MTSEKAVYTHGHHASVLRSHTWRTAQNSAAYILPHLKPHFKILDLGCGPGTITVDLAKYVPEGHITGLETPAAAGIIEQARSLAKEKGVDNVDFVTGDGNALDFPDDTFDVVICHQVLQHVRNPVDILREMRRVARHGGIVAARESIFAGFKWYPESAEMSSWLATYMQVARHNGGEPDAGLLLHVWAKKAGFSREQITCSSSTWCYSTPAEIEWWSDLWAERTLKSAFATTAIQGNIVDQQGLEEISETWRKWGKEEEAWFSLLHGEVICRKE
ncbi:hypothetical protein KEM56_006465 [Ascosphaera pollenicola]|nr:hypothetical protein KEM56_006465 [Ascosphaera pollenicola]